MARTVPFSVLRLASLLLLQLVTCEPQNSLARKIRALSDSFYQCANRELEKLNLWPKVPESVNSGLELALRVAGLLIPFSSRDPAVLCSSANIYPEPSTVRHELGAGMPNGALALFMRGCNFNPGVWHGGSQWYPTSKSATQLPEVFPLSTGLTHSHTR